MRLARVRIRTATEADLRALCALGMEINALHHAAWPGVFAPTGDPARDEAFWRPFVSESDSLALLAEIDGAAIGMVVASITEEKASLLNPVRYCRIDSIGVAAAHRSNGIARTLQPSVPSSR